MVLLRKVKKNFVVLRDNFEDNYGSYILNDTELPSKFSFKGNFEANGGLSLNSKNSYSEIAFEG